MSSSAVTSGRLSLKAIGSAGKYFLCGPQFSVSLISSPRASNRRRAAGRFWYAARIVQPQDQPLRPGPPSRDGLDGVRHCLRSGRRSWSGTRSRALAQHRARGQAVSDPQPGQPDVAPQPAWPACAGTGRRAGRARAGRSRRRPGRALVLGDGAAPGAGRHAQSPPQGPAAPGLVGERPGGAAEGVADRTDPDPRPAAGGQSQPGPQPAVPAGASSTAVRLQVVPTRYCRRSVQCRVIRLAGTLSITPARARTPRPRRGRSAGG